MKRLLKIASLLLLSLAPFLAFKFVNRTTWGGLLNYISYDCFDRRSYEGIGRKSAQVEFPKSWMFPDLRGSAVGLFAYPRDRTEFLLSGKGTIAASSDLRPMSNRMTLPEYIYAITGHDIRTYLDQAKEHHLDSLMRVELKPKPLSQTWINYGQLVPEIDLPPSLLLIFPAKLVPTQTPFLIDQPEFNYLFIESFTGQSLEMVRFDGCQKLLESSAQSESRYIAEFPVRPDQINKVVEIYAEVTNALCH
jgi:hypothetical protein